MPKKRPKPLTNIASWLPPDPKPPLFLTDGDVSSLIRLIDHCKRQEIAYFEGPGGLRFGFSKAGRGSEPALKVKEADNDWIP